MKKIYFKSGFTLIELMVVISIIGLLSSVVLAALSTSRVRASDSAIKSSLKSIQTTAEIEYGTLRNSYSPSVADSTHYQQTFGAKCSTLVGSSGYTSSFFRSESVKNAITNIMENNGGQDGYCTISPDGKAYAIAFPLKSAGGNICIDHSGVVKTYQLDPNVSKPWQCPRNAACSTPVVPGFPSPNPAILTFNSSTSCN